LSGRRLYLSPDGCVTKALATPGPGQKKGEQVHGAQQAVKVEVESLTAQPHNASFDVEFKLAVAFILLCVFLPACLPASLPCRSC